MKIRGAVLKIWERAVIEHVFVPRFANGDVNESRWQIERIDSGESRVKAIAVGHDRRGVLDRHRRAGDWQILFVAHHAAQAARDEGMRWRRRLRDGIRRWRRR